MLLHGFKQSRGTKMAQHTKFYTKTYIFPKLLHTYLGPGRLEEAKGTCFLALFIHLRANLPGNGTESEYGYCQDCQQDVT